MLEPSAENIERFRLALEILPDKAIREMSHDDLQSYTVVRVADEIVIDLMLETCGISYETAEPEIEIVDIDDTLIPFANANLLFKMKQTGREKDLPDLQFLTDKLQRSS